MLATAETERTARSFAEPSPLVLGLMEYRKLTALLNITLRRGDHGERAASIRMRMRRGRADGGRA